MSTDERQAERAALVALSYAVTCVTRAEHAPSRAERTVADMVEGYATDLLDRLDGSIPRALSAARAACLAAAREVAHPGRWRGAIQAVELGRRAAAIAARAGAAQPEPEQPGTRPAGR